MLLMAKHPETAEQLKLAALRRQSMAERAVRTLAVCATRRWDKAPRAVAVLLSALARIALPGRNRMFRVALDFCYALGAARADPDARPATRCNVT
jgi:hypothetical protein